MADEIPGLSPSSGNKDGKKDDKKDALPPTLKDFQKTRIKLQGMGPRTLMERLKSFRKKDLLFILSGLGVLVGAPLAEHLMTGGAPSGFQQGWDFKNGLGGFGGGGSPFEPGVNGLAPGQAAGGNGDIITPFNARDPASLILGPDGDEQPPVGAPAAAPSSDNDNGGNGNAPWRNVLAQAVGNAAGAATQSAGLPVASPMLGDDFLGGASAPQANTSASYTPPPISAGNVPNRAAGNDSLSQVRGNVAGATPFGMTGQSGSAEDLKSAGNAASGYFNRPTSAANGLQNAASVSLPGGGSGNGGSGAGGSEQDKALGQDQNKDSKSAGESLAEKAAEQNQQHAIDLYWKKIEAEQMFPITEGQKVEDAMLMAPINAFTGIMTSELQGLFSPPSSGDTYNCGPNNPSISACETVGSGGVGFLCADKIGGTLRNLAMCNAASGGGGSAGSTGVAAAPVSMSCPFPDTSKYGQLCTLNASGAAAGTGANGGGSGFGGTSGTSVGDIGKDGGTQIATQDAKAMSEVLGPLCVAAKKQANTSSSSGFHFPGIGNPHAAQTTDMITDAKNVLSRATVIANQINDFADYSTPGCGVTADNPSSSLAKVDDARQLINTAWTDFNNINDDATTMLGRLSGVLCQGSNPCQMQQIAQAKQTAAFLNTWWGGVKKGKNVMTSKYWKESLTQANTDLTQANTNLTQANTDLTQANTDLTDAASKSTPQIELGKTSNLANGVDSVNSKLNTDFPGMLGGIRSEVALYQSGTKTDGTVDNTVHSWEEENPMIPVAENLVNSAQQVVYGDPGNSDDKSLDTYYTSVMADVGSLHSAAAPASVAPAGAAATDPAQDITNLTHSEYGDPSTTSSMKGFQNIQTNFQGFINHPQSSPSGSGF